jgi:glycosyltransferase involved in cell wall biosynthesis
MGWIPRTSVEAKPFQTPKDAWECLARGVFLRPFLEAIDVFALSSLHEGLPNVVLEAMAYELPVVATRIAGIPRLIQDGVNGIIIAPDCIDSLATALARLVDDDQLRLVLGRAARHRIEHEYSFAHRMRKVQSLYDDLLRN